MSTASPHRMRNAAWLLPQQYNTVLHCVMYCIEYCIVLYCNTVLFNVLYCTALVHCVMYSIEYWNASEVPRNSARSSARTLEYHSASVVPKEEGMIGQFEHCNASQNVQCNLVAGTIVKYCLMYCIEYCNASEVPQNAARSSTNPLGYHNASEILKCNEIFGKLGSHNASKVSKFSRLVGT